jgi:N-acetylglutamate synthase-like GNAT family acetyltransferase
MIRIDYLAGNESQIPILANWHYEQWAYLNPGVKVEEYVSHLQKHLGKLQVPTTFVAFSNEVLLGSASLVKYDMSTRMDISPWLASVFVAPDYRNKGVGSMLVKRVVEEAMALKVPALYLFTPDRETFYARMGWSVLERTRYKGENIVIMSINLEE